MSDGYPKGHPKITDPKEVVSVLMTEEMARRFEARCLKHNTKGYTQLAGPLLFSEDDLPSYIIQVGMD